MNRLQSEWHRLYLADPAGDADIDAATSGLIDSSDRVRAMVLELARPADWDRLAEVWRAVQADLDLPAPGIAVSGTDGFQLWFSLATAVSIDQAHAFVAALRSHYLADLPSKRVGVMPATDDAADAEPGQSRHARRVPARQEPSGTWSAFVAPDLAPVFADTPWLDSQPSDDGQAGVLRRLKRITPAEFAAALAQLQPAAPAADAARPDSPRDEPKFGSYPDSKAGD